MDASLETSTATIGEDSREITVEDLLETSEYDYGKKTRAYTFQYRLDLVDDEKLIANLEKQHVSCGISPVHDSDVKGVYSEEVYRALLGLDRDPYVEPTPKIYKALFDRPAPPDYLATAHRHVVIRFQGARYLDSVRTYVGKLIQDSGGKVGGDNKYYVQPVIDLVAMTRYLCHLDSPRKHKYKVQHVISLGFFDLSPLYASSLSDDVHSFSHLLAVMRHHPGWYYNDLCDYVFDSGESSLMRALTRYSYVLGNYVKARRNAVDESGMEKEGYKGATDPDYLGGPQD